MSRNYVLLDWLKHEYNPSQHDFMRVSYSYLRLIAYGHKHPSARVAMQIELATGGRVTRQHLREDWREIWPELESKENG